MRIDTLRSFTKVVELGSYAAAADILFTSVTTLHSHIKSLEQELNLTLITFSGRRLELTHIGTQFLSFAERTLADYDALLRNAHTPSSTRQKLLRVVSLPGPGVHLLPPVIQAFQSLNPHVRVTVDTKHTEDTLNALASSRADIAIVHAAHVEHAQHVFDVTDIFTDRLVCVIRNDLYEPPDVALFSSFGLAVQDASSFSRQYVAQWSRQANITTTISYEHASFDGILSYVLLGNCIGVVGEYSVAMSPSKDLFRTLLLPGFNHTRTLVALCSTKSDGTTLAFINTFREHYLGRS